MRKNNLRFIATGIIAAGLVGFWLHLSHRQGSPPTSTTAPILPEKGSNSNAALQEKLRGAASALATATDAAGRKGALASLREALAGGSTKEVSAAIRRFLDSKADAKTGQGFKVGKHGVLTEAPTLRTFLLDYLGQIDPAAAAEYSRVVLASKDSPDEWAVALRNLAAGDSSADARALLTQKTGELLDATAWQQNPSVGYLEAFDVSVYLGGTNFVPTLGNLLNQQSNPAIAHAAYLALDRLAINDPSDVLGALLAQPDLMAGRDQTRADLFARADVRDPQQRALLENYLLNSGTGAAQLRQFASIFPNANYMISQNLLTPAPTADGASLAARDAESLRVVQQWIADPRFASIIPQLQTIQSRLVSFTRQAGGAQPAGSN